MSTNWYVVTPCGYNQGRHRTCVDAVHDHKIHIGKTYGAGLDRIGVTLRAYAEGEAPWGAATQTWEDWKILLSQPGIQVTSQYGDWRDPEQWVAWIESITTWESRARQYQWYLEHSPMQVVDGSQYLDPRGYSMSRYAFS